MSYISTGDIPCDTHKYEFPPVDSDGNIITIAEHRRLADAYFHARNARIKQEIKQDKFEQRQKWERRIGSILPCLVGTPTVR